MKDVSDVFVKIYDLVMFEDSTLEPFIMPLECVVRAAQALEAADYSGADPTDVAAFTALLVDGMEKSRQLLEAVRHLNAVLEI